MGGRRPRAVSDPESAQLRFAFGRPALGEDPPPETTAATQPAGPDAAAHRRASRAEAWFERGCELESEEPGAAESAYRRALEEDPDHADARVNLGRLRQEDGELEEAAALFRGALEVVPTHATAAFNLGVVLEDLDRPRDAVRAYERALSADPGLADAHYNLAALHERRGDAAAAVRHLREYRKAIARTGS